MVSNVWERGISNKGRSPKLTERSRNCTLSLWLEVRGSDNSWGESWEGKTLVYVVVWPWSCRGVRSLNRFSQWGNAVRPRGVAGGEDGVRWEDWARALLALIQHCLNATLASSGQWESQVDVPASGSPGTLHTPEVLYGKLGSSVSLLSPKHHWNEERHVRERKDPLQHPLASKSEEKQMSRKDREPNQSSVSLTQHGQGKAHLPNTQETGPEAGQGGKDGIPESHR